MMVCLIFHTTIIINRKNWRITIKLHFKNLSISFKKSERTHMLGPPPSFPLLRHVLELGVPGISVTGLGIPGFLAGFSGRRILLCYCRLTH